MRPLGQIRGGNCGDSDAVSGDFAHSGNALKAPNALQRFVHRSYRGTMRVVRNTKPSDIVASKSFRFAIAGLASLAGASFLLHSDNANERSIVASLSSQAGFEASKLVVKGNKNLNMNVLKQKLAVQLGGSLFDFDVDAARQQVISNPWVKHVEVRKVYPDTIVVDLVERTPVALWKSDGVVNIISAEGHVIAEAGIEHMRLPQVVGQGANDTAAEFLSYINQFGNITSRARAYVRVADRRWNVHLDNGPKIMLPERNWKSALSEINDLNTKQNLFERDIVQVDMRLPDRLVLKMSSEQAKLRKTAIENALKQKWHKI